MTSQDKNQALMVPLKFLREKSFLVRPAPDTGSWCKTGLNCQFFHIGLFPALLFAFFIAPEVAYCAANV